MRVHALHRGSQLQVAEYLCSAGPGDRGVPEVHSSFSLSFVRRGTFSVLARGKTHELLPGSVLVGSAGTEYRCTHEHAQGGDECLSFRLAPELVDEVAGRLAPPERRKRMPELWQAVALAPRSDTMVMGALAQAAAVGASSMGLDEAALLFVAQVASTFVAGARGEARVSPRDRRRVVEAALFIEEQAARDLDLGEMAAHAELSAFHFLRVFAKVVGVTPHQYLVRCRLARAARLLAQGPDAITDVALEVGFNDLSNFVRTFHRAAGMPPRAFRRLARGAGGRAGVPRLGSASPAFSYR